MTKLTAVQQDYLELVLRMSGDGEGVRVTDIASVQGIKPPTVVRTLARLRTMGLVSQRERGLVHLTQDGNKIAGQLLHRHRDIAGFLTDVLGVSPEQAEADACVIEHGLGADSADRLHFFLLKWSNAPVQVREALDPGNREDSEPQFDLVKSAQVRGSRI